MSAASTRRQLDLKRRQRVDAEKKAGEYRIRESKKRAEADRARQAAGRASNTSTQRTKLSEAGRREDEAAAAGRDANRWQGKAIAYAKEESVLQGRLQREEASERAAEDRKRQREKVQADRRAAADRAELEHRIATQEVTLVHVVREVRPPKPEKLRVLLLGASSDGELRIGREQQRIRAAVERALHRDRLEFDTRPAATAADLLDGITRFRPHIVHFSGHADVGHLEFERDMDALHEIGQEITASAFRRALAATDDPPVVVLLNACNSAQQAGDLVVDGVPLAIGMSDEIGDGDAIVYATQFYASVANGQSVQSAHLAGQAALELAGLSGVELPVLATSTDIDPATVVLVAKA